ncbi:uncharacterized protein FOMMEDRAFT_19079 [Fomitiporia mediterranea MF3/22]|uniref:uncharacterized protein n=1 Tax=Fomitiporia mediterranea (strain MF3/22) TaxID=694068 RepID=UPI0004409519|nr:uncharacterized protein FOMMEDRAFT_19079 [Fomitiporia mediterranea MF3/22]EJD03690.1 hypothetical protein FOMMEDRAFT_19079 [Fomitiporia mediterranea MF3/22]
MPTTTGFPALPQITGDLILEAFSHESLNLDYHPENSTDNGRLIELGGTMLEFVATRFLYAKKPIVRASDIPSLRDGILSLGNYETWVSHYNLRQRLRYTHSDTLDVSSPEETRSLFRAYVGAVVVQSGPQIAMDWIAKLIDPEVKILSEDDVSREMYQEIEQRRANKRQRTEAASPVAAPPPMPPTPPPSTTSVSTSIPVQSSAVQASIPDTAAAAHPIIESQATPSRSVAKFLPLFNQRCSQNHLTVQYQASNHASPHAPLWIITCLVNGVQKGEGRGSSKQIAKEAAAQQAYYAMGWDMYGLPS